MIQVHKLLYEERNAERKVRRQRFATHRQSVQMESRGQGSEMTSRVPKSRLTKKRRPATTKRVPQLFKKVGKTEDRKACRMSRSSTSGRQQKRRRRVPGSSRVRAIRSLWIICIFHKRPAQKIFSLFKSLLQSLLFSLAFTNDALQFQKIKDQESLQYLALHKESFTLMVFKHYFP